MDEQSTPATKSWGRMTDAEVYEAMKQHAKDATRAERLVISFGPVEATEDMGPSDYDEVTDEEWRNYCANDCAPELRP